MTTIRPTYYFLGAMMFYVCGLFVTFFSQGAYSMQALVSDVVGGTVCVLITDLIVTVIWELKKSFEED